MSSPINYGGEFTFTWKIQNYSSWNCVGGEEFFSPRYTAESLYRTRWHLGVYPKGYSETSKEYIGLYLYRDCNHVDFSEFEEGIFLNIKLEILNPLGNSLCVWKTRKVFNIHDMGGSTRFMKADQLMNTFQNWDEDTLTIRCHMSKEPKLRLRNQCEIHTKINVVRSSHKWHVNKMESSNQLEKTIFSLFDSFNFEVTLSLPSDKFKIKVTKTDILPLPSQSVTCKISLLNTDGEKKCTKVDTHYFNKENIWEFPDFITESELQNEVNKFLKNGMFTLVFEFTCSNGMVPLSVEEYTYNSSSNVSSSDDAFSALQKDLGNMLNDEKYCDVKISADNELMPAHKAILAARSPVLSVMLDQKMLESETGIVDIPDLDKDSLKLFWEFIYTGKLNTTNTEVIFNLFLVADRLEIVSLRDKCSSLLITTLSDKNVCEIFKIADMLGHSLLKESALKFILFNACSVLSSPEWTHWVETDSKLTSEILSKMSIHFGSILNKTSRNAVQYSTTKKASENINETNSSFKPSSQNSSKVSIDNSSKLSTQNSFGLFGFGSPSQNSFGIFGFGPPTLNPVPLAQSPGPSTLNPGPYTPKPGPCTSNSWPYTSNPFTENAGPSLNSGSTTQKFGLSTSNPEPTTQRFGLSTKSSGLSTQNSSNSSIQNSFGLFGSSTQNSFPVFGFGSPTRTSVPSTLNSSPSTTNLAPFALNPAPSALNTAPSALNAAPSAINVAPPALNPTSVTINATPVTINPTPSTINPTPSTINPTPSTINPTPFTINPAPSGLNPGLSTQSSESFTQCSVSST